MSQGTLIPQRLKRLAVLAIAREYSAQYEWFVHEPKARAAGLAPEVIEAIRVGARPAFANPEESLVYEVAIELLRSRTLNAKRHRNLVEALGEAATVELIALIGFYIGLAVLLVAYDVDAPNGALPLPGVTPL